MSRHPNPGSVPCHLALSILSLFARAKDGSSAEAVGFSLFLVLTPFYPSSFSVREVLPRVQQESLLKEEWNRLGTGFSKPAFQRT